MIKKFAFFFLILIFIAGCDYIFPPSKEKVLTCNIVSAKDDERIIINNESFTNNDRKIVYEGKVDGNKFLIRAKIPYLALINFNNFTLTTLRGGVVIGEKLVKEEPPDEGKIIEAEFEINLEDDMGVTINKNFVYIDGEKIIIEKSARGGRSSIPVDIKNITGNARFIINNKVFSLCDDTLCVGTTPPKPVKKKVELENVIDLANLKTRTIDINFDLSKKELERFILKGVSIGKTYNAKFEGTNASGDKVKLKIESKSGKNNKEEEVKIKDNIFKYDFKLPIDDYKLMINEKIVEVKFQ